MNRDRFVLSNGHACALLYNMLNLCGYKQFTLQQLKKFRQLGSMYETRNAKTKSCFFLFSCCFLTVLNFFRNRTPGHPENYMHGYGHVGGIEVTTGPLGQGIVRSSFW